MPSTSGRYGYSMSDDLKMLKSLYDRLVLGDLDASKPCGLKIWRTIIEKDGRFKCHSAQALATRMRRFIVPNLAKLCQRLPNEIEEKLLRAYKGYIDDHRNAQRAAAMEIAEEENSDDTIVAVDEKPDEPFIINDPERRERRKLGRAIIAGISKLKPTSAGQRLRRIIESEDEEDSPKINQRDESMDSSAAAVVDFLTDSRSTNEKTRADDFNPKTKERRKRKLFVEDQVFLSESDDDEQNTSHDSTKSTRDYLKAPVRVRSSLNEKKMGRGTSKLNADKPPKKAAADGEALKTSEKRIHLDEIEHDMELDSPRKWPSPNRSLEKSPTAVENQDVLLQSGPETSVKRGKSSPMKSLEEKLPDEKSSPDISQTVPRSPQKEQMQKTPIKSANQGCQTSPEKLFVRKFGPRKLSTDDPTEGDSLASPKKNRTQSGLIESVDQSCQTSSKKSVNIAIDGRCEASNNKVVEEKDNDFVIYGLSAERIEQIFAESCPQKEISEEILMKMHLIDKMCKKSRLDRATVLKLSNLLDWKLVAKRFDK